MIFAIYTNNPDRLDHGEKIGFFLLVSASSVFPVRTIPDNYYFAP
jgi:hypothetical protein